MDFWEFLAKAKNKTEILSDMRFYIKVLVNIQSMRPDAVYMVISHHECGLL